MKREDLKKKAKKDAEKRREVEEARKLREERAKNPLLYKALDELESLKRSQSSGCDHKCSCQCGKNNDWGDYASRFGGGRGYGNSGGGRD